MNRLLAERHASFSRRHFFQGLGACIALPAFSSLAHGASRAAPTRMAVVYVPNGIIPVGVLARR